MAASGRHEQVMVPVPEEHLAEVLWYLKWGASGLPSGDWDQERVGRAVSDLDEQARRLLLVVAEAADEGTLLTLDAAAERAGSGRREVLGLIIELNDVIRHAGGPPMVMATADLHGTTETGPSAWSLNMPGDVARFILGATGRGVRTPDDLD